MISPLVAIIADDLTGALDVAAPFARHGLKVAVTVSPRGLPEALNQGADIVCVNTASRELPSARAASEVEAAARILAEAQPAIVFNKIDSRLKGHVALGIDICRQRFGRAEALLAPAIPAQKRIVQHGHILGEGVSTPIDVAATVGSQTAIEIADCATEADMERLARVADPRTTLLVGASGLGLGLAQALTQGVPAPWLRPALPLLFAIGSHDPLTLAQVERLRALPGLDVHETADGMLPDSLGAGIAMARADSDPAHPDHRAALAQFGRSVAAQLRRPVFNSVLLCGGETAQTVLNDLGVDVLTLRGEAASGIPLCETQLDGRALKILTKSGGFGTPDDLFRLAQVAENTPASTSFTTAGINR